VDSGHETRKVRDPVPFFGLLYPFYERFQAFIFDLPFLVDGGEQASYVRGPGSGVDLKEKREADGGFQIVVGEVFLRFVYGLLQGCRHDFGEDFVLIFEKIVHAARQDPGLQTYLAYRGLFVSFFQEQLHGSIDDVATGLFSLPGPFPLMVHHGF